MMPHVQQEGMKRFITGIEGTFWGVQDRTPSWPKNGLGEQGKETGLGFCGI